MWATEWFTDQWTTSLIGVNRSLIVKQWDNSLFKNWDVLTYGLYLTAALLICSTSMSQAKTSLCFLTRFFYFKVLFSCEKKFWNSITLIAELHLKRHPSSIEWVHFWWLDRRLQFSSHRHFRFCFLIAHSQCLSVFISVQVISESDRLAVSRAKIVPKWAN